MLYQAELHPGLRAALPRIVILESINPMTTRQGNLRSRPEGQACQTAYWQCTMHISGDLVNCRTEVGRVRLSDHSHGQSRRGPISRSTRRRETLIGRGTDCHISLPDPLCSRVHARLTFQRWDVGARDAKSRNGTLVNGPENRRGHARRRPHAFASARVEFEFHRPKNRPRADEAMPQLKQTIVQDLPIAVQQSHTRKRSPGCRGPSK